MGFIYDIPNNFIQEEKRHYPAFLAGYNHYNYVNLDIPSTYSDFDNLVVGLFGFDNPSTPKQIFNTLVRDEISTGNYRFYFDFSISNNFLGKHFFAIYNSVTEDVIYQSNYFKVIGIDEVQKYVFVQMRNSSNHDNFNYKVFPEDNSFFLEMNKIGFNHEQVVDSYRERSTGIRRVRKTQKIKYYRLEAYFFDEVGFDALNSMIEHDNLRLNGEKVTLKTSFEASVERDMNVHKGVAEVYIDSTGTVNLKGE